MSFSHVAKLTVSSTTSNPLARFEEPLQGGEKEEKRKKEGEKKREEEKEGTGENIIPPKFLVTILPLYG